MPISKILIEFTIKVTAIYTPLINDGLLDVIFVMKASQTGVTEKINSPRANNSPKVRTIPLEYTKSNMTTGDAREAINNIRFLPM